VGQARLLMSQVETGKEVGSGLSRDVASLTASLEVKQGDRFCRSPKRASPKERQTCLRHLKGDVSHCLQPDKTGQDRLARPGLRVAVLQRGDLASRVPPQRSLCQAIMRICGREHGSKETSQTQ